MQKKKTQIDPARSRTRPGQKSPAHPSADRNSGWAVLANPVVANHHAQVVERVPKPIHAIGPVPMLGNKLLSNPHKRAHELSLPIDLRACSTLQWKTEAGRREDRRGWPGKGRARDKLDKREEVKKSLFLKFVQ